MLPVDQLVAPEQRFRCVPYSATISARTCVERQARQGKLAKGDVWIRLDGKERPRGELHRGKVAVGAAVGSHRANRCANCELGRAVVARIEGAARAG